jgi:hypothetical protein
MREIFHKHKSLWSQRSFLEAILIGFLLLAAGLAATYYANFYTTIHANNSVTDIILDNIPTVNVDFFFSDGATIFWIIVGCILAYEPRRIPFALKSTALFVLIRSGFMILTHLAPPLHGSYVDPQDLLYKFSSGDDLFFSAHTGLPFLFALIFWEEKYLKYFFLFCSVAGATIVLLGHLHYSIDVFSALFISFGIFYIAQRFFSADYRLIKSETFEYGNTKTITQSGDKN